MSRDPADPFKCPVCGERDVECRGDGARDCNSCPFESEPKRDIESDTKQSGIGDYDT